ncbi:alpha-L-arabinofuranosidase [Streptomyces abyssalis]|uniref:non-reducing end alpha-L-arabinofuranosidase n=1 Tax=Streptomyces abyssalis TaxID=933944 RepID=A0A1E7JP94_9ACTN|nr:alpha-N-arabinofuranosidase [Streptomyces abyssalis]OEU86546.1 alpha-L-arabinofuranosidase [Streptomyces abyssalis]OEU90065.1 alpha-L-arabinofuranosidase [Streptomyces abyssalis]OEV29008.1 alpha-L-arabinofuranosidase [Streptomyces nanshensis]
MTDQPVGTARFTIDPDFALGTVDPRLYGTFVEHMGRCVYTGIHEPDHETADEHGFRGDVSRLVRELGTGLVRYPGGNFVSGYHWEDGIGPAADRPRRLDLAWRSIETNQVGTDEFLGWARRQGVEPMMAVNLGTRGIDAARALVEYCNIPGGTAWSDLRVKNGVREPHGVRLWCLGNEMDGPWQTGHTTAREYGRLAAEAGKSMHQVDPSIELVACGSSNARMPTFGEWERQVLHETYDEADYLSLHAYYEETGGDRASFLASGAQMDAYISDVVSTADHVRAVRRSTKRMKLSFDEWNVWYQSRFPGERALPLEERPRLIEDTYSVTDAAVVGSLLMTLLRHADRVAVACLAQLVNVIGPIRSEPGGPSWRQTTFHPFALTARHARGTVLRTEVSGPVIETEKHGPVQALDTVSTLDPESGELTVLAVNRHQEQSLRLSAALRGLSAPYRVTEHLQIADPDPDAANTEAEPDRVVPRPVRDTAVSAEGELEAVLPPVSWSVIRLTPEV